MLNKIALYSTALIPAGLYGCSAAGPPPPPLAGGVPVIDKVFFYVHSLLPFFIFLSAGSIAAGVIYFLIFKRFPFFKMIKKNIPEEIVKERYAKGELSREEFLTIMEDINPEDLSERGKEERLDENE